MTDAKVPPQALSSDTLEKARRNSLVWSALAVASELVQNADHKIKSSIIGPDATLPVSMVALICIALSAFHLLAFIFEAKRISRWQSEFAKKHSGATIEHKITELYSNISNLALQSDHQIKLRQKIPDELIEKLETGNSLLLATISSYEERIAHFKTLADIGSRREKLAHPNPEELIGAVMATVKNGFSSDGGFSSAIADLKKFRDDLSNEVPSSTELKDLLNDISKNLSKFSKDIAIGEQRYFIWYEVGSPLAAFAFALILWVLGLWQPDYPLIIQNAF